ncbi:helix-turn-helix domain-containing protein [Paraburkholderia sp. J10-1]|uniref:helix-turn-helix transcriptional regulator n=1 Tax=Paraburkholderia sp. J10-1 TaxID=2805430 RepID=UPI002AB704D7|nr:helix-turn-helix domain-containing protein [Paraburkholderia sp. J10-1]
METTTTIQKLHRINAAAKLLGVSRETIYRFARAGKLVRVQIGDNSSGITDESIRNLMTSGVVASQVARAENTPDGDAQVTENKRNSLNS